jgi:integrase
MQTETNLSEVYRVNIIHKLKQLAEYYNPKPFKEMTRQDILNFLDKIRKPENADPLHKWLGTYEITRIIFLRFFKWLHYPDTPEDKRPKPAIMENINKIKRREISIYKPTDLWTEEDDVIFYKYCPSVRDRCWHAVSRDTGCRPSELLKLKIKDVVIQQLEGGYQIAKITVNGKTGVRNVRLNNSYPFLKEWLSMGHHPFPSQLNAPLFCGMGKKNTGRKISIDAMQAVYEKYKKQHSPSYWMTQRSQKKINLR